MAEKSKDELVALGFPQFTIEDFHATVSSFTINLLTYLFWFTYLALYESQLQKTSVINVEQLLLKYLPTMPTMTRSFCMPWKLWLTKQSH